MNKLIFNGKEYKLIETPPYDRFKIHGEGYEDIGYDARHTSFKTLTEYTCFTLRIKDKHYGLQLIDD